MTHKQFKQLEEEYKNNNSFNFHWHIDISMSYDLAVDYIKELIKEDLNRVKPEYF